jgi:nucleotide-binding universal stress UspA family protein
MDDHAGKRSGDLLRIGEGATSLASITVHVDVERDCEQRVQLALALADRFQAGLIGVAGLPLAPARFPGLAIVDTEGAQREAALAQLDEAGKKFCAQGGSLSHVEWRTGLEPPLDMILREARAADLIIVGPQQSSGDPKTLVDPGVILLRAGRPVLLAPDTVALLPLRRVVVAWTEARECRRAVRDSLAFLQQAKEVLLVTIGEEAAQARAKQALADVASYLVRHRVIVADELWRRARGPVGGALLELAKSEGADLIVAGGYGHSRLGEMVFGGVTHDLLASNTLCCLLSH